MSPKLGSGAYVGLARLLERVRHWRATEVYEDDEPVSADQRREAENCGRPNLCLGFPCDCRVDHNRDGELLEAIAGGSTVANESWVVPTGA